MLPERRRIIAAALLMVVGAGCSSDRKDTTGPSSTAAGRVPGGPDGWFTNSPPAFTIGLDHGEHHGGNAALYVTGNSVVSSTFAAVSQSVKADDYRGRRVRWSGWVKQEELMGTEAGLWMRVDGPGVELQFDNMENRALTGSADWHQVSVVLDVPQNALGFAVGILSNSHGTLLVDDLKLEVVGNDVPTTSLLTNYPNGSDSLSLSAGYSRAASTPVNTDFEGLVGPSSAEVAWLTNNAVALSTADPNASLGDLAPLTQIVGDAHLVGMGEDTHGTRQFFQMKHRILEYLVTQLGFTTFAIEATTPESDDMNRYVLTGQGDPHVLLSNLYFWTWNTQEVFDMIQWMRQWNSTAPADKRVQFLGFDMQFPGAAIDSVTSFIARVDPSRSKSISDAYACIAPYRDVKGVFRIDPTMYASLSDPLKAACAAALQSVFDLINSSDAQYTASTSSSEFQHALHAARLVQQFEAMESTTQASATRDRAMAENVQWIRDQAGPQAKIALWAHNGHINAVPSAMGGFLHSAYGADYLPIGFAFGSGGFNAVSIGSGVIPSQTSLIPPSTIEAAFNATNKPMLMLDTRLIPSGGSAAAPLAGPILMRSIGAVYSPSAESQYFVRQVFPEDFNVLIYLQTTSPSTLLPFVR